MIKNIVAWKPYWYELDQSIVVGDKGWFYLSLDKCSFSNDMASENDVEVVAEINKISHGTLGIVKGILTDGLDYLIVLENGDRFNVNAEESPGRISESKFQVNEWNFQVEIEIIEETGFNSMKRIKETKRDDLKKIYMQRQEDQKRLLGVKSI